MERHITSSIKLIEDLVSLGHNIYCYILEQFVERFKNTGGKLKVISFNKNLSQNGIPDIDFNMFRTLESILSQAEKDQEKYEYLIVDSLFDGKAMNKILKPQLLSQYIHCR